MDTSTRTRLEPTRIAPETFLLHDHEGEGTDPVLVPLNTMVIRGAEPVVVDTGPAEHADRFFAELFEIVEPEDIRWVFISHDDVDHTGNLNALMHAAPNATLVVNWFTNKRMGGSLDVPLARQRWVGDGDSFDAGDRTLVAIRPPIFDSPTTRGLLDPTTGVYWASDAFSTPMLTPVRTVGELDGEFWRGGMHTFDRYISPWLTLTDDARYQATVDRIEALSPSVIAACHTPAITGRDVAEALAITRRSPVAEIQPEPDQAVLDRIVSVLDPVSA